VMRSGSIYDVMFFDDALTQTQLNDILALWHKLPSVGSGVRKRSLYPVPVTLTAPKIHFDFEIVPTNPGRGVIDLSGNGNNGVVTQASQVSSPLGCKAIDIANMGPFEGRVSVADAASIQDLAPMSISIWLNLRSRGYSNVGRLLDKGPLSLLFAGGVLRFLHNFSVAHGNWDITVADYIPYGVNTPVHIVVTYDSSDKDNDPTFYINGIVVPAGDVVEASSPDGVASTDVGSELTVGNDNGFNRPSDGVFADFRYFNSIISAGEVKDLFLPGARAVTCSHPRFNWPESTEDKTAWGQVGPWEVLSGTWRWVDNGVSRGLYRVANGAVIRPQPHAYGSWYFKATYDLANYLRVPFICNSKGEWDAADQDGYQIRLGLAGRVVLQRVDGGAPTTLFFTDADYMADGVEYEFLVTRSTAQGWEVWIKGGAYTSWTSVDSGTDDTYTRSAWCGAWMESTIQRLSDFKHFLGSATPSELGLGV